MNDSRGVYDDVCELVQEKTSAETVLLVIFKGRRGNGFSMATIHPAMMLEAPAILRKIADKIEQSGGKA